MIVLLIPSYFIHIIIVFFFSSSFLFRTLRIIASRTIKLNNSLECHCRDIITAPPYSLFKTSRPFIFRKRNEKLNIMLAIVFHPSKKKWKWGKNKAVINGPRFHRYKLVINQPRPLLFITLRQLLGCLKIRRDFFFRDSEVVIVIIISFPPLFFLVCMLCFIQRIKHLVRAHFTNQFSFRIVVCSF